MSFSKSSSALRARIGRIADILEAAYPDADCALKFNTPMEILIATILSAQCTDAKVNEVTPLLFARYDSVEAFATAKQKDVEKIIKPIGLYHNKAKNIIACCRELVKKHDNKVPEDMASLTALPGVGRKTANCVLVNAYGKPGLMTDTHFCRIMQRLGLSRHSEPAKIETDIAAILPKARWGDFSHRIIIHGRQICKARKPLCDQCPVARQCNFFRFGETD